MRWPRPGPGMTNRQRCLRRHRLEHLAARAPWTLVARRAPTSGPRRSRPPPSGGDDRRRAGAGARPRGSSRFREAGPPACGEGEGLSHHFSSAGAGGGRPPPPSHQQRRVDRGGAVKDVRPWTYAALFGTLWGAIEATLGTAVHLGKLPLRGTIMGLAGLLVPGLPATASAAGRCLPARRRRGDLPQDLHPRRTLPRADHRYRQSRPLHWRSLSPAPAVARSELRSVVSLLWPPIHYRSSSRCGW